MKHLFGGMLVKCNRDIERNILTKRKHYTSHLFGSQVKFPQKSTPNLLCSVLEVMSCFMWLTNGLFPPIIVHAVFPL